MFERPPTLEETEILDFALTEPDPFSPLDGIDTQQVSEALYRLPSADLITADYENYGRSASWWHLRVAPLGLKVLGEWPDVERIASAVGIRELFLHLAYAARPHNQPPLRRAAGLVARTSGEIVAPNDHNPVERRDEGSAMTAWERRNYPVLRALVDADDENLRHGYLNLSGHTKSGTLGLDLSDGEISDALLTLGEADYVHFQLQLESGFGAMFTHLQVTGAGHQALGEWPLHGGDTCNARSDARALRRGGADGRGSGKRPTCCQLRASTLRRRVQRGREDRRSRGRQGCGSDRSGRLAPTCHARSYPRFIHLRAWAAMTARAALTCGVQGVTMPLTLSGGRSAWSNSCSICSSSTSQSVGFGQTASARCSRSQEVSLPSCSGERP